MSHHILLTLFMLCPIESSPMFAQLPLPPTPHTDSHIFGEKEKNQKQIPTRIEFYFILN